MELITSRSFISPEIENFIVQLKELNMICCASDAAKEMDFESADELQSAIKNAIEICIASGFPMEEHFRRIYKCSPEGILYDWKLSLLAYKLVCLNGSTSNPKVAQLQVELIKSQSSNNIM
ncbi:MAG: hypothetical protein ACXVPU_07880 [Bacteroidia bacterium]